ncbi:hypothetical protein MASR2M12_05910 [Bacteroidales bacterium]
MFKNSVAAFIILIPIFIFRADGQNQPNLREEANIYQKVYDAPLRLIDGEQTRLHQIAGQKPLVLVLLFTRCTGVCYPYLGQLKKQFEQIKQVENEPFQVLVVSFDPRDTQEDMQTMAEAFSLQSDSLWEFAVTDSIEALTKTLGFNALWNEELQQFEHDAILIGLNQQAYITRKLIGFRSNAEIGQLLADIHNVFSPTFRLPNPKMRFACFDYDPATGRNKPSVGLAIIALPAALTLLLLFVIWLRTRNKPS